PEADELEADFFGSDADDLWTLSAGSEQPVIKKAAAAARASGNACCFIVIQLSGDSLFPCEPKRSGCGRKTPKTGVGAHEHFTVGEGEGRVSGFGNGI